MNNLFFERLKSLCAEKGITLNKLEKDLDLGKTVSYKWANGVAPSVDRVIKIANYFDVSIDYLMGETDIRSSAEEIINDEDIISLQRARQNMSDEDKKKMMDILKIGFEYAFQDGNKNG